MRRRDVLASVGGTAFLWPLAARPQQPGPMRRIGVLIGYPESDRTGQAYVAAFRDGLQKLGWAEGRNLLIDTRWVPPGCGFKTAIRQGTRRATVRLDPFARHAHHSDFVATNAHNPNRVRGCFRSDWQRVRGEL